MQSAKAAARARFARGPGRLDPASKSYARPAKRASSAVKAQTRSKSGCGLAIGSTSHNSRPPVRAAPAVGHGSEKWFPRPRLTLGAVRADDGALEVDAVLVVERAAAGDERQVFLVGRADDLLDRCVGGVEILVPIDLVRVVLPVVAGDVDLVALGELTDVVENRRSDVPIVEVTGHHDVVDLAEFARLLVPGDDPR